MGNLTTIDSTDPTENLFRAVKFRDVACMSSYGLAKKGLSEPGQLAAAVKPEEQPVLVSAWEATSAFLARPAIDDGDMLIEKLHDIVGLIRFGAAPEHIDAWVKIAMKYLLDLPARYLPAALDSAIEHCQHTNEIVPHVTQFVKRAAKMPLEHLQFLTDILQDLENAGR